jgi:uncharacterized membrane protein HdeD (DUF308 family)
MATTKRRRIGSISTGLRALVMLLAGLFAIIWPMDALAVLVLLAGALFLVDGVLGLWAVTFGGAKTGNFWFDVVRNVLSILMGALIFLSPLLATVLTATVLVYLVAFQAIVVGGMEIWLVIRERESYAKIWPVLLNGALYLLFGILLLFAPLFAATVFVIFAGVLAILFSFGLFGLAFRLHKQGF